MCKAIASRARCLEATGLWPISFGARCHRALRENNPLAFQLKSKMVHYMLDPFAPKQANRDHQPCDISAGNFRRRSDALPVASNARPGATLDLDLLVWANTRWGFLDVGLSLPTIGHRDGQRICSTWSYRVNSGPLVG